MTKEKRGKREEIGEDEAAGHENLFEGGAASDKARTAWTGMHRTRRFRSCAERLRQRAIRLSQYSEKLFVPFKEQ